MVATVIIERLTGPAGTIGIGAQIPGAAAIGHRSANSPAPAAGRATARATGRGETAHQWF